MDTMDTDITQYLDAFRMVYKAHIHYCAQLAILSSIYSTITDIIPHPGDYFILAYHENFVLSSERTKASSLLQKIENVPDLSTIWCLKPSAMISL